MLERDEFARAQGQGPGCGLWLLWTLACAIGAGVGQTSGQTLAIAVLGDAVPSDPVVFAVSVIAGAVMGALLGVAQGLVLVRYLGARGLVEWVLATAFGGALRWAIIGPIGQIILLNIDTGIGACNLIFTLIIYGVLAGLVFGIPQALVLRRQLGEMNTLDTTTWTLANAAAGVASLPIITLSGLAGGVVSAIGGVLDPDHAWRAVVAVAIVWAVAGAIGGIALRDRIRYYQHWLAKT